MDNSAQIDYWNGPAGEKWVRDADRLDRMLAPFADAVIAPVKFVPGQKVLDVGCGAGALSLGIEAAAVNVAITGVDVSEPLIALARSRAQAVSARSEFVVADAAAWQPKEPVDAVVSRFGVMFFEDPAGAFLNLRMATKPGGQLSFACWRPLPENDWAMMPLQCALPFLKEAPQMPEPGAPGPFSFGDAGYVTDILTRSGWREVTIAPWDGEISLPGASPAETAAFMIEIGPLTRLIKEQALEEAAILEAVEAGLKERAGTDGRTRLKAAAWIIGARA
ncbi:class I SAM-dependent methyltransferase [Hyphomonas sp.]|uniref:class I SAM-dependent methyltransferase n=1 Tax=Hyphomonas sp. TaxID=87 RepID=UPI00391D6A83